MRTLFAASLECAGIYVLAYEDPDRVTDAEREKVYAARDQWLLRLTYREGVRAGRAYWTLAGRSGGRFIGEYAGGGTPQEIVSKVCAIAAGRGATVSHN